MKKRIRYNKMGKNHKDGVSKNSLFHVFSEFVVRVLKLNVHPDFVRLFLLKEGRVLMGKRYKNLIILVSILSVTLMAIAFANGSLQYLAKKMNDPFVKFVDIEVSKGISDKIGSIQYELNNDSLLKQKFHYISVLGYSRVYLPFQLKSKGEKRTYVFSGRTISLKDPLLKEILRKKNLIKGKMFRNKMDLGLIITKELLDKLGLPITTNYLPYSYTYNLNLHKDTICPLPVVAIIKELPGMNKFATTPYFESQVNLSESNPFDPGYTKDIVLFFNGDSSKYDIIRKNLIEIISSLRGAKQYDPEIDLVSNNKSFDKGVNYRISFFPRPPQSFKEKLVDFILRNNKIQKYKLKQVFDFNPTGNGIYRKYDIISVHFKDLNKVRKFKDYILKKYKLEIDMARIDSLENYNFISKITRIISLLLIGFSVLSICLFVGNLLSRHLERIHMNIGSFKAFGIDNNTLTKIYLLLIYLYVFLSLIISFIISWLVGLFKIARFSLLLLFKQLETGQSYYNLFEGWTYIAIILMLLISFIVLYRNAKRILQKTPGDLIYSRI